MDIDNNSCTELTVSEYEDLALARGLTGLVCGILATVILLVMIGGMIKSKFSRGLLEWIVIYLSVLTIVDDVLFLIIMVPSLSQWFGFCRALGIGLEMVNWVQQGCTLVIAFHQLFLLHKLVQKIRNPYLHLQRDAETQKAEKQGKLMKMFHHAALLLIWLPVVLNVVWLPFEAEDEFQEQEPEWCWIVSITDDCEKDGLEFAEELIMWYLPVVIVGATVACTAIATLVVWMYTAWKKHHESIEILNEKYKPNNFITLVTYSALAALSLVEIGVRTYTIVHRKHNFVMWTVFAVAVPFRDILLPICYTVQVYLYRKQYRNMLHPNIENTGINTSMNSDMAHFQPTD